MPTFEEGRRAADEFLALEPMAALAQMADATVEECHVNGARWTLRRVLERRNVVGTILLLRRLAPLGLATVKCLVGTATEDRVTALGDAIDDRNPEGASEVLKTWVAGFRIAPGEADLIEPLAERLVAMFTGR